MVRVLDSRTGLSGFESHSGLNFFNLCFVKDNIKQDLDLEPVKVNSTTSKGMGRVHKDNFFIFFNLWYGP